jgi:hypothetical protein
MVWCSTANGVEECPKWVKSGHCTGSDECPLYLQKRTLHCTAANVRFVPKADILRRSKYVLFNHLIGEREHIRRDIDAQHSCSSEIQKQLEFARLHHRQIGRSLTLENTGDVVATGAVRAFILK